MKRLYLDLSMEATANKDEIRQAKSRAQALADRLGVTVNLTNGNYGAYVLESKVYGSHPSCLDTFFNWLST